MLNYIVYSIFRRMVFLCYEQRRGEHREEEDATMYSTDDVSAKSGGSHSGDAFSFDKNWDGLGFVRVGGFVEAG